MDIPPVPPDAATLPPVPSADAGPAGLQFDKADFGTTGAAAICTACQDAIAGEYYDVNNETFCPRCKAKVEAALGGKPGPAGFFRAIGGGVAGGVAGALVYYLVLAVSGYDLAIIAIGVGWLVGKGVQWGTRGRGGPIYQALAIVIAYVAIVSLYVPMVVHGLREAQQAEGRATAPVPDDIGADLVVSIVAVVVIAIALPFLGGFQNIFGLVIIAIGLYEAWKLNKRVKLTVTGPFHAAFRPTGAAVPGA